MKFSQYKNLADVLKEFIIQYKEISLEKIELLEVPEVLKDTITFNIKELPYDSSEIMIGETIIFPILREVWKSFKDFFVLWSHQTIQKNNSLGGIPDYIFAKQSKLGKIVLDKPIVAIIEAKKDDFTSGWGQCLAEMYVAQEINENKKNKIFGCVTNGKNWEFGYLIEDVFFKYQEFFNVNDLKTLYSVIYHILNICKNQI